MCSVPRTKYIIQWKKHDFSRKMLIETQRPTLLIQCKVDDDNIHLKHLKIAEEKQRYGSIRCGATDNLIMRLRLINSPLMLQIDIRIPM